MPVMKAPASPEPKPRLRHLNEHLFRGMAAARRIIEEWRTDYNEHRPHSQMSWQTPDEFASTFTPRR
jgi:putative transposase